MTSIEELEQKIKQGEALLAQERIKVWSGWVPFIILLPLACRMSLKIQYSSIYFLFPVFTLLYMGFAIWRMVNANRNVKLLGAKIQQYREQKTELENSKS